MVNLNHIHKAQNQIIFYINIQPIMILTVLNYLMFIIRMINYTLNIHIIQMAIPRPKKHMM